MKRRAAFLCLVLLLFLAGVSAADVIPSDRADEWGGMAGLGKKSFRFLVLGDTQPLGPGRALSPLVDRLLKEAGWLGPDFIVHLGDSISGYGDSLEEARQEYSVLKEKIGRLVPGIPFLAVPGNHDQATPGALAAYREAFGSFLYYDFPYGNARFVVLNGNFPAWMAPKGKDYGFFNLNDGMHVLPMADWAREAFDRGGRMLFVFLHTPPYPAYTPPPGNGTHGFLTNSNRDAFVASLPKGRTRAVFSGHEHLFYVEEHGGIKFFTVGTGGGPLSGPVTGPAGLNAGISPRFNILKGDPEIDRAGGTSKGLFRSGALGIFASMVVKVDGDKVAYELAVPFTLEVSFPEGNDGVSTRARAVLENRGRFAQVLKGITFLMPSSPGGYALKATAANGDRTAVEIGPAPEVLEVTFAGPGRAFVRVQATVPPALAVDLRIETR
jgi:predicted phosphodiesterase